MNLSRIDLYAALSYVAGGGLLVIATGLGALVPQYQTKILAISGITIGLAGLLVRLLKNPSPPAGTTAVVAPTNATPPLVVSDLSTTEPVKGP
jgi:hypothetical protein